jgi:hypothetical protein
MVQELTPDEWHRRRLEFVQHELKRIVERVGRVGRGFKRETQHTLEF